MTNTSDKRMDANQERAIAHRLLALEATVRGLLGQIPACRDALDKQHGPVGRTRAAAVDRLESALSVAGSTAGVSPPVLASAREAWAEAQTLRWTLALSATRVAYGEAHKLASNTSMSQPDLVQEGMIGLLDAAKRFEPDRDNRFATYARWWVRAHMTRAIDLSRMVRLPAGACEQLRNLRKQIRIEEQAGRTWTVRDLSAQLSIPLERTRSLLAVGIARSLDDLDAEGQTTGPQLADEATPLDEVLGETQQIQQLMVVLETALPDRQRRIVMSRYGIGREVGSLAEIARGMKLSRERIRQLDRESMQLLRDAYDRIASPSVPNLAGRVGAH